jgi:gas vesicle protein
MVTGAVIGATTSMLMMPQMDGRTRRKINKMSRRMSNRAGEFMDDIKGSMM